jgi:transcriptional regulator with XRE-family HTH domain
MAIARRFLYVIGSALGELMRKPAVERQLKLLGESIRELRHLRNLSQEELAARANIHVTYLSAFECGKRNPSLAIFFSVASALKVTPAQLLQSPSNDQRRTEVSDRFRKRQNKRPILST